jgi:hypothetical protein
MHGRSGGRGSTSLYAHLSGGRLQHDFVAPVYMWAWLRMPLVRLPFAGEATEGRGALLNYNNLRR